MVVSTGPRASGRITPALSLPHSALHPGTHQEFFASSRFASCWAAPQRPASLHSRPAPRPKKELQTAQRHVVCWTRGSHMLKEKVQEQHRMRQEGNGSKLRHWGGYHLWGINIGLAHQLPGNQQLGHVLQPLINNHPKSRTSSQYTSMWSHSGL